MSVLKCLILIPERPDVILEIFLNNCTAFFFLPPSLKSKDSRLTVIRSYLSLILPDAADRKNPHLSFNVSTYLA